MRSLVVKRSIAIGGRETSVSLEHAFWSRLKEIARQRQMAVSDLIATIDSHRQHGNLSSALRILYSTFIVRIQTKLGITLTLRPIARRRLIDACAASASSSRRATPHSRS